MSKFCFDFVGKIKISTPKFIFVQLSDHVSLIEQSKDNFAEELHSFGHRLCYIKNKTGKIISATNYELSTLFDLVNFEQKNISNFSGFVLENNTEYTEEETYSLPNIIYVLNCLNFDPELSFNCFTDQSEIFILKNGEIISLVKIRISNI